MIWKILVQVEIEKMYTYSITGSDHNHCIKIKIAKTLKPTEI